MQQYGGRRQKIRIEDLFAETFVAWLIEKYFPGISGQEVAKRLDLVPAATITCPWWQDIPAICKALGVDIGLTIRDSKGNEMVIWPSEENFSQAHQARPSQARRKKVQLAQQTVKGSTIYNARKGVSGK